MRHFGRVAVSTDPGEPIFLGYRGGVDEEEAQRTALPPKMEAWRRRSATGAILTGFAFGLREVFEPEREEPAIVQQVPGEPPGDLPVEAHLDGTRPDESVVTIRPWLLTADDEPE
jgi:hypothetical protein